jgi:hypothetical protein
VTQPRQVVAGRTYLISRRCTQRQHLLRPEPRVEQIYLYCLGEATARYGVTLHGFIAMSNHQHLIVRDNRGNFPAFLAHFHKMVAKAVNALRGRWENLWASEQPNAVYLVEAEDRFDKLVYLLANPVADHLVEHVADWPGAISLSQHLRPSTKTVKRPRGFFRERGPMPSAVELRIERLEGFEALSDAEWARKISAALRNEEARARAKRAMKGGCGRVLGRKAVLRTKPTERPRTFEARGGLRPQVACRNLERRIRELRCLRAFRIAHRNALTRWLTGQRRVLFPTGTYRMALLGACCEAPS